LAARYREVVSGPEPPIWFDSDHCPFCPWRAACDATALERRDLATLPALRRNQARALRQSGVNSVPELAALPLARLAALPDSDTRLAGRLRAGALALQAGRAIPHPESATQGTGNTAGEVFFLDVETDPLTRVPWAIGWMDARGEVSVALVAPGAAQQFAAAGANITLARSAAHAWQLAARAIGGTVLHWGDAESLILARTAAPRARAALGPRLLDLHALVVGSLALPIPRLTTRRSASLKAVAGWLGYQWPGGADHWADGWRAYRAWRAARRARERRPAELLAPAMGYLTADLVALARVWHWLDTFTPEAPQPLSAWPGVTSPLS
jgi:uncharacterized protein